MMVTDEGTLPAVLLVSLLALLLTAGCGPGASRTSPAVLVQQGASHYEAGRYQRAVDAFTQALSASPRNAEAYLERGRAYAALGDFTTAVADYETAVGLDSTLAVSAYYYIGVAHYRRGDLQGAYDGYSEVIALRPDFAAAYLNRADVALALGRYEQTVADAGRVLELEPVSVDGLALRGSAYEQLGQTEAALSDLKAALALDADRLGLHIRLGAVYARMSDFEQALEHLQTYLQRVPDAPDRERVATMIETIRIQQAVAP